MWENVFKQMEAQLTENKWVQSDFRCDKRILLKSETTAPFLWVVTESSTCIQWCSRRHFKESLKDESCRFAFFRNNLVFIQSVLYVASSKNSKLFYFDGEKLIQLQGKEEAIEIYMDAIHPLIEDTRLRHPLEYAMANDPLKVISLTEQDSAKLQESLEYAKRLNDNSLQRCLDRLSNYTRFAVVHYVQICKEHDEHCFFFSEKANGDCLLSGGIIYHECKTENRWQIHT